MLSQKNDGLRLSNGKLQDTPKFRNLILLIETQIMPNSRSFSLEVRAGRQNTGRKKFPELQI